MKLRNLIYHLVNDVKIPKGRVATLLEVDTKTVTNIMTDKDGYNIAKIAKPKHGAVAGGLKQ